MMTQPHCDKTGLLQQDYIRAAESIRILAHPHRLQVVHLLLNGRYSVGQLAHACHIPSSMMSDHLRLMQRCGFLSCQKEGRTKFYAIVDSHLANIMACIEAQFRPKPRPFIEIAQSKQK